MQAIQIRIRHKTLVFVFMLNSLCVVMRLQRFPTDRAYFIAKELLTTERTYVKDLEVMTVVRPQTTDHSPNTKKSNRPHAALLFVFCCAVLWVENIDYSG